MDNFLKIIHAFNSLELVKPFWGDSDLFMH